MTPTRACRVRISSSSVSATPPRTAGARSGRGKTASLVSERPVFITDASQRREAIERAWRGGDALEIGVDHHLDEAGEIDRRRPAKLRSRLVAVANQMLDFGRTNQRRIELDVLAPVEAGVRKRHLHQV